MSAPSAAQHPFKRLSDPANRIGLLGAAALLAAAAFAVYSALPIIKAVQAGGATSEATDGADAILKYASNIKNDADQINGRSFFFDPPRPPDPYVPPPPKPPEKEPEPYKPPAITSYGGPAIIGTVFDTVWFDKTEETMRVGGPVKNDTRIISISSAPYVVKLEWKGVVFDVPFMPRDYIVDKSRPAPPKPPEPPPSETKPAEAKPGEAKIGEAKPGEAKPGDAKPGAPVATPPAPSATPGGPGDKKDEKKEEKKDEPKPAGGADKPADAKPASPAPTAPTAPEKPPEKKDGSP